MSYTSLTKAQLIAQLAQRDAELITKGKELEAMRLRISQLSSNVPCAPRQVALPLAMQHARELAMRCGITVKVQA